MKSLARTSLVLIALTSAAYAEPVVHETVVHQTTTPVQLKLDASTVLCSSADYGATFLKVLIPDLAGHTLLDHQNTGAGAPCVAAGPCQPGHMPSDIIDPKSATEAVVVSVKAVRVDESDAEAQTCTTSLKEQVNVTIRGVAFKHERFSALGERPFSDCVTTPVAATGEPKTDDAGQTDDKSTSGCNTSGGNAGGLLVLALGALLVRRRR
jgi:MYXO-CTERM domain-containing protein